MRLAIGTEKCRQAPLFTGCRERKKVWVERRGTGAWLRSRARVTGFRCPLPGAEALQQVEKLRVEMLSPAPPHLCSGWDPPVPGCCDPRLKLCLRLRAGHPLPGPSHNQDPRGRKPPQRAEDARDAGSPGGTQGSAAEGRARHAAPRAPGTGSAPPRAPSQLALTGSPVSSAARPPAGRGRSAP